MGFIHLTLERTPKPFMTRNELAVMVNLDPIPIGLHFDSLSGQGERDGVAVRLESHQTVLGNMADRPFLEDICRPALRVEEKVLFLEEHLGGLSVGRPMDPDIGHRRDPFQKTRIEMIEIFEGLASEESLDVLDARLDLAFGLGTIGPMRPRLEPVIFRKVPEDRVPLNAGAVEVPAEDDRLQVVVDDLVRNTSKMGKGGFVTVKESRELFVPSGLGIHPPAVAQSQDKEMDLGLFSAQSRPALSPISLTLAPRRRFESDCGLDRNLGPERADEPLDCFVTPRVTPGLDLFENRPGAITDGRQPPENVVRVGSQDALLAFRPCIRPRRHLMKNLTDSLDVETQSPGNGLFRFPKLAPAVNLLPQICLDHVFPSQFEDREEAYALGTH